MYKHFLILFAFCLCLNYWSFAQSKNEFKVSYNKLRNYITKWQIHQLADSGALIVRLPSKQKLIQILTNNQQNQQVEWIKKQRDYENAIIIKAFLTKYQFSPVYFTYDYLSLEIIKGKVKNVFLNENLQIDSTINLKQKYYLFADIQSPIIESTLPIVPDSLAPKVSETGSSIKTAAILIKNKYGHQLKRPFPYYVSGTNILKYEKYVSKLNRNFLKFYQKTNRPQYIPELKPYLY